MATEAEIEAARAQILADIAAGVESTTVDGERVDLVSPESRLDALDRIQPTTTPKAHFGMRTTRLISPGGWS